MALPYNPANAPLGFPGLTINLVTYVVDDVAGSTEQNDVISRTDGTGARADFYIRKGSEQVEVTFTLQKETATTALPPAGEEFSYDYDESGTPSTLVVKDVQVQRAKDALTTIEMVAVRKTYQG